MREKLPFTTDMIIIDKAEVFSSYTVQDKLIVIAMEMQVVTLFRISEMVVTADDHYLRAMDVLFTVRVNRILIENLKVEAHVVYQYLRESLVSVTYVVRSAITKTKVTSFITT